MEFRSQNTSIIYITKWVLTKGILETPESQTRFDDDGWIWVLADRPDTPSGYFPPIDWYRSKEEAIARAEKMRDRKIASLKKQIAKLKEMEF